MNRQFHCRPPDLGEPIPKLPPHWAALERLFARLYRVRALSHDPAGLLAYNLYRYRGRPVPLREGPPVTRGDLIMELHLRREALGPLLAEPDPLRRGVAVARAARSGLRDAARALVEDPALADVRALYAVSLYHSILNQSGFEIVPLDRPWMERALTAWQRVLARRDGGLSQAALPPDTVAREAWLSRAALLRRFKPSAPPRPPG